MEAGTEADKGQTFTYACSREREENSHVAFGLNMASPQHVKYIWVMSHLSVLFLFISIIYEAQEDIKYNFHYHT